MMAGMRTTMAAETLEGPQTQEAAGTAFEEVDTRGAANTPAWAQVGENYDPLTSEFMLVKDQVSEDFPEFRQYTMPSIYSDRKPAAPIAEPAPEESHKSQDSQEPYDGWSLLGLRTMQGYREMRPPEVSVEFMPTIEEGITISEGLTFEEFNRNLEQEIRDEIKNFDFHNPKKRETEISLEPEVKTPEPETIEAPAPLAAEAEPTPVSKALEVVEEPAAEETASEDQPTLNIKMQAPSHTPTPAKPIAVVPLRTVFPRPEAQHNITASTTYEVTPAHGTPVSVGPESLEHVAAPEIPEFTKSESSTPTEQTPQHDPATQVLQELPATPVYEAVEAVPSKTALPAANYEQQVDALTEQFADVYDIHPLEVSLKGIEKTVENFLGRHKKAARIAEYAGAAVIAAAAGSRLLRRFRGRR